MNLPSTADGAAVDAIRRAAIPLTGGPSGLDAILDEVGHARIVMLGECTHGTHEFYAERARITRCLVEQAGFRAVAIEGDWPDAFRVNRFLRGDPRDPSPADALSGFRRFPAWMWRNADVVDLVGALRRLNDRRGDSSKVGFYGLDLYSLHSSMEAVIRHLDRVDPAAAREARARYACFDRFGEDPQRYGMLAGLGAATACEDEAIAVLLQLRRDAAAAGRARNNAHNREDAFDAEQNARLVHDAERYYRTLVQGDTSAWNLRDRHMADTLQSILQHIDEGLHAAGEAGPAKVVVWAHNSHVGDARATEMGEQRDEMTLGQLARERWGASALLVGFTTAHGHVTAARDWDAPSGHRRVLPARTDSVESWLHRTGIPRFLLPLRHGGPHVAALKAPRLHRAIGVVYRPDTERHSHYLHARIADAYDALVHVDATTAVEPLEPWAEVERIDLPETYPTGV